VGERVLVTGGTGFIGRALVRKLKEQGRKLVVLGSADGDIADERTLKRFARNAPGHVFHLAGRTFVPESWKDPAGFYRTNVLGTLNVLELCRRSGASLTFVSAYVYGTPDRLPVKETAEPRPNNPYGHSKAVAENLCRYYADTFNLKVGIARVFNVYGSGQDERFVIPTVLRQLRTSPEIRIKDSRPRRDYIHVDDVVEALAKIGERRPSWAIFNVASGTSHSVGDIIALLQKAVGVSKPVIELHEERPNEIPDVVGDNSRAAADLGWRPQVSMEEGIRRLAADSASQPQRKG
jgi:GDP-4-dehydro-6-deoxy-D-mannose reductase